MPKIEFEVPAQLGKRVHAIGVEHRVERKMCGFCGGEAVMSGKDGTKESCPRCRDGVVDVSVSYWVDEGERDAEELFVRSYRISALVGGGTEVVAILMTKGEEEWDENGEPLTDIFLTKKEAQAEIERRERRGGESISSERT